MVGDLHYHLKGRLVLLLLLLQYQKENDRLILRYEMIDKGVLGTGYF
jgi:hypothetical protein